MKILYPPHPNIRIPSAKLNEYEKSGNWVAQRKFNGTNVVIYVSNDRKVHILTRHGTPPKLFSLSKSHVDQILSLNFEKGKDYWLNGELLDHKTKNPDYKKKIVLFDECGHNIIFLFRKHTDARVSDICKHKGFFRIDRHFACKLWENLIVFEKIIFLILL